jgi:hypothetical protein
MQLQMQRVHSAVMLLTRRVAATPVGRLKAEDFDVHRYDLWVDQILLAILYGLDRAGHPCEFTFSCRIRGENPVCCFHDTCQKRELNAPCLSFTQAESERRLEHFVLQTDLMRRSKTDGVNWFRRFDPMLNLCTPTELRDRYDRFLAALKELARVGYALSLGRIDIVWSPSDNHDQSSHPDFKRSRLDISFRFGADLDLRRSGGGEGTRAIKELFYIISNQYQGWPIPTAVLSRVGSGASRSAGDNVRAIRGEVTRSEDMELRITLWSLTEQDAEARGT